MEALRAAVLLAGFVSMTLALMPLQWLFLKLRSPMARYLPLYYHRVLCRWLGIAIRVEGRPVGRSAMLFLANHTSYFDILILSTVLPVAFVAKREVASWPFFGWLAKLQRTVFVERDKRSRTGASLEEMSERLAQGDNLVLFPEGTSNDGNTILPFKTALVGAAQSAPLRAREVKLNGAAAEEILVQPVSVAYRRVHGLPMGRQYRPFFAWYGDMELVTHLWDALCLGPLEVVVTFHAPVPAEIRLSRKAMAAHCHKVIASGVAEALHRPLAVSGPIG